MQDPLGTEPYCHTLACMQMLTFAMKVKSCSASSCLQEHPTDQRQTKFMDKNCRKEGTGQDLQTCNI